jgi:hypothetical protein
MAHTPAVAGPSKAPAEARPSETVPIALEKIMFLRNLNVLLLKHPLKSWNSLFDMLRESSYQKSRLRSATLCQGSEVPPRVLGIWWK